MVQKEKKRKEKWKNRFWDLRGRWIWDWKWTHEGKLPETVFQSPLMRKIFNFCEFSETDRQALVLSVSHSRHTGKVFCYVGPPVPDEVRALTEALTTIRTFTRFLLSSVSPLVNHQGGTLTAGSPALRTSERFFSCPCPLMSNAIAKTLFTLNKVCPEDVQPVLI